MAAALSRMPIRVTFLDDDGLEETGVDAGGLFREFVVSGTYRSKSLHFFFFFRFFSPADYFHQSSGYSVKCLIIPLFLTKRLTLFIELYVNRCTDLQEML